MTWRATSAWPSLKVSESLHMWGDPTAAGRKFYAWIASDKEIVKSVLLLTGRGLHAFTLELNLSNSWTHS